MQRKNYQFPNYHPSHNRQSFSNHPHQNIPRQHSINHTTTKPQSSNIHQMMRTQQNFTKKPSKFRQYINKFQAFQGFHSANNSREHPIQQFHNWKNSNNNFYPPNYSVTHPLPQNRKSENSNNRQWKNSEIFHPNNQNFYASNQMRSIGRQPFLPARTDSSLSKLNNKCNNAPCGKNTGKPEVFQSMIISNNDFNRNSNVNMKNSTIFMGCQRNENSGIHQKNSPALKIAEGPMPLAPTSSNFRNTQKNTCNWPLNQSDNFGGMKQSYMMNQSIDIKKSIVFGEPNNSNEKKNDSKDSDNHLFEGLHFRKQYSREGSKQSQSSGKKQYQLPEPQPSIFKPNETPANPQLNNASKLLKRQNTVQSLIMEIPHRQGPPEFKKRRTQFEAIEIGKFDSQKSFPSVHSIKPKEFTIDDFEIIEKLGKGAFGDVFLAQEKSSKFVCVIKSLSKTKIKEQNLEEHVLRQIKIQSFLEHRHLVSLYGVFDDANKIYLILEPLVDGCLSDCKKRISQSQTAYIIKQVLQGLNYMHFDKVIHRDIKPQNIFMFEDYLKIGDFGCSVLSDGLRRTVVGCLAYISPEQLNQNGYDDKIDLWSVGVLTYQLLIGKSPFEADLMKMAKIQYQNRLTNDSDSSSLSGHQFPDLKFPQSNSISEQTQQFIKNLLSQNPEDRMDVRQALKHNFIKKSWQWQKKIQINFRQI